MSSRNQSIFLLEPQLTVGSSKVIDHVLDEIKIDQHKGRHVIAYFYCHYSEKGRNDPGTILSTIVKQLCLSMGDGLLPKEVLSIYEERENRDIHSARLMWMSVGI